MKSRWWLVVSVNCNWPSNPSPLHWKLDLLRGWLWTRTSSTGSKTWVSVTSSQPQCGASCCWGQVFAVKTWHTTTCLTLRYQVCIVRLKSGWPDIPVGLLLGEHVSDVSDVNEVIHLQCQQLQVQGVAHLRGGGTDSSGYVSSSDEELWLTSQVWDSMTPALWPLFKMQHEWKPVK